MTDSEIIGQMRADLIDMSYRLPPDAEELPRLWNAAYDALTALEHHLRASSASTRRDAAGSAAPASTPAGPSTPNPSSPPSQAVGSPPTTKGGDR